MGILLLVTETVHRLEPTVWPELRESTAAHGVDAGLPTAELMEVCHVINGSLVAEGAEK